MSVNNYIKMTTTQFAAEITDTKLIYNILKAISFQEFAVIRPMEEGLKITVEDLKTCSTSMYIPESTFSSFNINSQDDVLFKVSLKIFTECLHIYGDEGTPSMKLSYKAPGSPLCLVIKHSDENIIVDCQLNTMNVDDFQDISLADECNVNNIVFNGDLFVEVLSDLDMLSDDFDLQITTQPAAFKLTTTSTLGESSVDIPKSSEVVTIFQCKSDFRAKYAFSNLKQILKVMSYAKQISISTGESGLLAIQLIINSDERQIFVEYCITAMFEDD